MILSSFGRRLLAAANGTVAGTIIGLGTAAFKNTGTSGNTVPLLDGANTWSSQQNIGANVASGEATRLLNLIDTQGAVRVWRFVALNSANPTMELIQGMGATAGDAANIWWDIYAIAVGGVASADELRFRRRTGGTATDFLKVAASQMTTVIGSFSRAAPVTKTADFTVAVTENWLINNKAAATCTVTLPTASSFTGREIMIKNLQAFTVVSASSNVVPLAGGAAGTAILSANAGRFCTLVSDGTNWVIMSGVI